ncbi:imelysin family protein [Chitinimonas sp.]|uniref:imelysin family protein n=1 Tax=Chitinimonas sp. TaxID=1934313 RepID=UPI002F92454E
MKRRTLAVLPLCIALFGMAGAAELDAAATVANWQSQQLPRIQALNTGSKALDDSLAALCQRKTQANLDAARQAWLQTYLAWRAVEALPSGPALSRRTAWQIDVWPTKPQKVEEAVRLVEKDAPIADSVGATAQGLPALEYLLWGDDRAKAQLGRLAFRQRCEYANALADGIAEEADGLLKEWQTYAATPLDHDAGRQAFEEGVNLLAASIEALRDKKLAHIGSPKQSRQLSRQDFDAWRSRNTRAGLQASLDALESLFFGAQQGSSFADRLVQAEKPILVRRLREEFATARNLLAKQPEDMASFLAANPTAAQPLLDSFKRLQQLVELQVADAVGVTIGFKDSDGD